ncbi:MAG: MaoC family dehydratase [Rhodospirillales bacterium]|nr:MaoC family dehydratase [Rhodospirillales bacterium]
MTAPRQDYYLDELKIGDRFESGGYTFTESSIVDFAFAYDPQPFHIDADAARRSNYGGLIASGFHTLSVAFRLLYQTGFIKAASMGGPGMDELRWTRPVMVGDTIRSVGEVRGIVPSKSKPDRGILKLHLTALNQRDEPVMTTTFIILVKRRRGE